MNIEEFRAYCLAKAGVEETFPFGEETMVYKVMGKMFALASLDSAPFSINLKCEPEKAIELREEYEEVQPGFHMNKMHWNTVYAANLPTELVCDWIDHSYERVVDGLPLKTRKELREL